MLFPVRLTLWLLSSLTTIVISRDVNTIDIKSDLNLNPNSQQSLLVNHGKCKGLWRSDKLVGKCFGLSPYKKFLKSLTKNTESHANIPSIPVRVQTPSECRSLCCNIGSDCVTWQYQAQRDEPCKLGGPIRVDLGVSNWCEPLPPASWSGYRLQRSLTTADNIGSYGSSNGKSNSHRMSQCKAMRGDAVPHQCFGLGPERMHPETHKQMTVAECETACCASPTCEVWQAINGRGCFFNSIKDVHCMEKADSPYTGGRKCVPGFCGSPSDEKMMLSLYYNNDSNHTE